MKLVRHTQVYVDIMRGWGTRLKHSAVQNRFSFATVNYRFINKLKILSLYNLLSQPNLVGYKSRIPTTTEI